MGSVAFRPEVDEAYGLDARGLDRVEVANAVGLLSQVAVELLEPATPSAHIRFELPLLLVVKTQRELLERAASELGQLFADALALALQRLAQVTGLPFTTLTQFVSGHGRPFLVNREDLLATEQKMRRQDQLFRQIIADPDVNFGLDPSWCSIYPYQMLLKPGSVSQAEVRVQNYRNAPMNMEVALVAPQEWRIEPDVLRFTVPAQSKTAKAFQIQVPREWRPASPRFALAADVLCDRKYLGQIAEAVVELDLQP